MAIFTWAGIFFVTWWIVLFAVLPWGVKSQHETDSFEPGTDPGAPQRPLLLRKVFATTLVTAIVVGVAYAVWESGVIPFDRIPMPYPTPSKLSRK
jgi:predicted secreted protein